MLSSNKDILKQISSKVRLVNPVTGVVEELNMNTKAAKNRDLNRSLNESNGSAKKSQEVKRAELKEKIKLWSKRFRSTEENELKDLR